MKNQKKKWVSLALAAGISAAAFAGCGATNGDVPQTPVAETSGTESSTNTETGKENTDSSSEEIISAGDTFSFLIDADDAGGFYDNYRENPSIDYWLSNVWTVDGQKQRMEATFDALPAGNQSETMNTLIATREYADVTSLNYVSDSPRTLFEEGVVLDITEEVKKYMPNYSSWMEKHPEFASRMYDTVNGEKKILQLYALNSHPADEWCGYMYRRDWIVKYGKNPETGEPFTGGWTDGDVWEDDVVFPSGETYPKTISDWEWMMPVFVDALEDLDLSDRGYAHQIFYMGDIQLGDFMSGFGVGGSHYYIDKNGVCQFGALSDQYRAYVECMSSWYSNGWIDRSFDERTSDMFFSIDTENVYSGHVGSWYGSVSSLGNRLDSGDGDPALDGICVWGAPQPINDVYGDISCKNVEPYGGFTSTNTLSKGIMITEKAADKDLGLLLTALDWFYGEGALVHAYGLSAEENAQIDNPWYEEWGISEEGVYHFEETDGKEFLVKNPIVVEDQDIWNAARPQRMVGDGPDVTEYSMEPAFVDESQVLWSLYPKTSGIGSEITSQLTQEQSEEGSLNENGITTYMIQTVPEFITGVRDIKDDAQWIEFCDSIEQFNPEIYAGYINDVLGN